MGSVQHACTSHLYNRYICKLDVVKIFIWQIRFDIDKSHKNYEIIHIF